MYTMNRRKPKGGQQFRPTGALPGPGRINPQGGGNTPQVNQAWENSPFAPGYQRPGGPWKPPEIGQRLPQRPGVNLPAWMQQPGFTPIQRPQRPGQQPARPPGAAPWMTQVPRGGQTYTPPQTTQPSQPGGGNTPQIMPWHDTSGGGYSPGRYGMRPPPIPWGGGGGGGGGYQPPTPQRPEPIDWSNVIQTAQQEYQQPDYLQQPTMDENYWQTAMQDVMSSGVMDPIMGQITQQVHAMHPYGSGAADESLTSALASVWAGQVGPAAMQQAGFAQQQLMQYNQQAANAYQQYQSLIAQGNMQEAQQAWSAYQQAAQLAQQYQMQQNAIQAQQEHWEQLQENWEQQWEAQQALIDQQQQNWEQTHPTGGTNFVNMPDFSFPQDINAGSAGGYSAYGGGDIGSGGGYSSWTSGSSSPGGGGGQQPGGGGQSSWQGWGAGNWIPTPQQSWMDWVMPTWEGSGLL